MRPSSEPLATPERVPTVRQLLRAVAIALAMAGVILVTAVLPAEYGIDLTGIGQRIGLLRPSSTEVVVMTAGPDVDTLGQPVTRETAAFRSDEMTLTLPPGDGGEIKAWMARGRRFVFTWTAQGGTVNFEMHGEATNAPEGEFTSYWKGEDQTGANGAFEAPFDGTHGWFWENLGSAPVTITLKTSGYYDKLGRP